MSENMDRPTALYRHFDAKGALLYVGISISHVARLCQHRETSGWFGEIARVDIEWHSSRDAAIAAEKAAIVSEMPRHNVIHAKSWRGVERVDSDDFPQDMPWPIPAKYAVIAWDWNPSCAATGLGAVAIGYQPYRCNAPQWFDGYASTCGATDSCREDLTYSERKIAVLSDYFMLTHIYQIDPRVVTAAFMNIKEFKEAIASSPMGPSLVAYDLPYVEKAYPLQIHRFAHSVHVFPQDATAVAA